MLSKCANPACSARFLYLHEGRIFKIEVDAGPATDPAARIGGRPRRLEHFWLCGNCAQFMTLRWHHGAVVTPLKWPTVPAATRRSATAA
jgi:hypothetical protein